MATSDLHFTDIPSTPLLAATRHHVLQLWNEQHDVRLVYHNFAQAAATAQLAGHIAQREQAAEETAEIVQLAAWFYNTGYLYAKQPVAETGAIRAEFFLAEQHCPADKIQQVHDCILSCYSEAIPKSTAARILNDAVQAYDWVQTMEHRAPLLRLEQALLNGLPPQNEADWQQSLLEQMQQVRFYTAYGKAHYEPALAEHMLRGYTAAKPAAGEKETAPKNQPPARFERLARRPLRSSIQTFFRANYANHIRLSAIADNKAHIMISVNSILMSVAISMLTYQTVSNKNPLLILPIIMFLVTSLTSLIFAVLSSRPRVTSFVPLPDVPPNPVFFGNFVHLSLDQYEAAIDAMLRDGVLLFGNMARDLYYLGQVLDKKYRLLTFSYTIFMMGFIATVGAFLGAYFLE